MKNLKIRKVMVCQLESFTPKKHRKNGVHKTQLIAQSWKPYIGHQDHCCSSLSYSYFHSKVFIECPVRQCHKTYYKQLCPQPFYPGTCSFTQMVSAFCEMPLHAPHAIGFCLHITLFSRKYNCHSNCHTLSRWRWGACPLMNCGVSS